MIEQPNKETEELLNALIEDEPEIVEMNGKSYKIGALRHGLVRKLTKIALTEKDERKVTTKSVAAIILRRFWRIKLFYWFLWRWFYYVKEIPETEMIKVFIAAKKKLPATAYSLNITLLIGMKDTIMTMTRDEAKRSLHAQVGEQGGI
jgi:hypothetical protein